MKKRYNIQYLLALMFTLALVGCSNDDFLTTQSDEANVVSFSIGTDMPQVVSKARDGYRDWKAGDPTSFGAFGMYDRNYENIDKLFRNQEVTRSGSAWTYSPAKYWADYTWCQAFDFFGYMPYVAGATLTHGGVGHENEYTLSFPVTLGDADSDEKIDAVTSTASEVPLICHAPVHKTVVGDVINYEMDQVLTGFSLKFMLGTKMTALRDFVIKEVKIKGAENEMPYSGTVSRTYTYDPSKDSWSSGDVTWDIVKNTTATEFTVPFVDHDGDKTIYDNTNSTLRIGYSDPVETVADARQWGNPFYAIPSADFHPDIEVKYDVTVKDENGTYITTRSNIVSTIHFTEGYFKAYTAAGAVAKVNPIVVQIVPSYLYVMADADQRASWIIVQD